jgi:hypothetical protein
MVTTSGDATADCTALPDSESFETPQPKSMTRMDVVAVIFFIKTVSLFYTVVSNPEVLKS